MSYGPPQGGYPQGHGVPSQPPFQQGAFMPPHGPPQQQFGAPPGPPPSRQQQQPWSAPGGPPPQQYAQQPNPPASLPSLGYNPGQQAQGDASRDADALRSAMKGFGTNESVLIQILSKPDPLQMNLLKSTYNQRHRRDLEKDIWDETSKYFREGLMALVRGPLLQDVCNVHDAIAGLGTKESLLNDVLLGRANADLRAIKQVYQQKYRKSLENDVNGDLSLKTKTLFTMVMSASRTEENVPLNQHEIMRDVDDLYNAMEGRSMGADQVTVCRVISSRSNAQLRAIAHEFQQRYHRPLQDVLKKKFDGHMEDALLLMVDRASDPAMTDAVQLENSMKGAGTKDQLMVNRIVKAHWDRAHLDQVKRAYQHRYKKDLISRVKGEIHTNRDYENLMVAILT